LRRFAVLAAATAAQHRGAKFVTGAQVTHDEPYGEGVRIRCGDRTWTVEQAIVIVGPWTNRFVPSPVRHVHPRRLVMTWYHPRGKRGRLPPRPIPHPLTGGANGRARP
jgi:glycine/D-amino acid oxidase-like deaminating enzyme